MTCPVPSVSAPVKIQAKANGLCVATPRSPATTFNALKRAKQRLTGASEACGHFWLLCLLRVLALPFPAFLHHLLFSPSQSRCLGPPQDLLTLLGTCLRQATAPHSIVPGRLNGSPLSSPGSNYLAAGYLVIATKITAGEGGQSAWLSRKPSPHISKKGSHHPHSKSPTQVGSCSTLASTLWVLELY